MGSWFIGLNVLIPQFPHCAGGLIQRIHPLLAAAPALPLLHPCCFYSEMLLASGSLFQDLPLGEHKQSDPSLRYKGRRDYSLNKNF